MGELDRAPAAGARRHPADAERREDRSVEDIAARLQRSLDEVKADLTEALRRLRRPTACL